MTPAAPERALSWLVLEQYVLGELDEAAVRQLEARLAVSAADREALAVIRGDASALPPLPFVAPEQVPLPVPVRSRGRRATLLGFGSVLAAAAAWALLFTSSVEPVPGSRHGLKGGGELAVRIVSERGRDASSFSQGERFKVLVTCPPALTGELDVVVFQDGERYRPLPSGADLSCGNAVPWPGAFALDGTGDVLVCVAPRRSLQVATTPSALLGEGVCERLTLRN